MPARIPRHRTDAHALAPGDYLRIIFDQYSPFHVEASAFYARTERIEVLPADGVIRTRGLNGRGPVAVFCHGVPGPLVLHCGDHQILAQVDADRDHHEQAAPWWSSLPAPFFTRAHVVTADRQPPAADATVVPFVRRDGRPPRMATTMTMPAHALRPGDYLEAIAARHPAADRSPDEGFARVQWIEALDPEHTGHLTAQPAWRDQRLLLVRLRSARDILLLPADSPVRVLAYVNPERAAFEGSFDPDGDGPPFDPKVPASRPFTPAEEQAAHLHRERLRQAVRVPADEADLYPQRYTDPAERRRLLHGVNRVRLVPLSSLPWPHGLFKCAHAPAGERLARGYPHDKHSDGASQAAHAELFTQLSAQDFAACPYHQANWPLIGEIARRAVAGPERDWRDALTPADTASLTRQDEHWLDSFEIDPIAWDDGHDSITNGQHRLCALRAAGVLTCPVDGRHVPDDLYPSPVPAHEHAQQTITGFWTRYLTKRVRNPKLADLARRLLLKWPAGRLFLFGTDR
ncbi:hypothetical protein AB0F17_35455 [Nonomuraea sp. NPDC026600]|uniref:hypothetical protein n=1 Tax=Nonomuraea sp. NPDC026600 TaxID=3155363 RepID=UPI0033CA20BE